MPDKKNEKKEKPGGKEDKSIANTMDSQEEKQYPRPSESDRQFDNQPEFNERTSSTKDKEEI